MPFNSLGRLILLVQGDADTGQSLSSMLSALGHEVRLAVDARRARKLASESSPDIVVMDAELPDGSGRELAREFRTRLGMLVAPIVMISRTASDADKRLSFDAGCDYHLTKPLDLRYLASLVSSS